MRLDQPGQAPGPKRVLGLLFLNLDDYSSQTMTISNSDLFDKKHAWCHRVAAPREVRRTRQSLDRLNLAKALFVLLHT